MARIRVAFDGRTSANGSPLLMHNERLADQIDPYCKYSKEISSKTKKTERDAEELGRREFIGGGYWSVDEGPEGKQSDPYIPTWNIVRCLQEAATRQKLGKKVLQGIIPIDEETPLIYDGPRDAAALWKDGTFHSRKGVNVSQRKITRTRPCFTDWQLEVELELDLRILDPDVVNLIAVEAGRYIGLGDARPRFGRFQGSVVLLSDSADLLAPDLLDEARVKVASQTARASIKALDDQHSEKNPNGKERAKRVGAKISG